MSTTTAAHRIGLEATVTPAGSSGPARGFVSDAMADGQLRIGAYPGVPGALTEPAVVPASQVVEFLDADPPDGWHAITLISDNTGVPIASIRLTDHEWNLIEQTASHNGQTVEQAVADALRHAIDARKADTD